MVTLGILTALGGCEPQLEVHVKTALTQAAGYRGFPKALNAIFVAKKVFADRGLLPVTTEGQ